MRNAERGSAILMLFILVALFGLLSYAFLRTSDSNVGWLSKEQGKAAATGSQDCTNTVNMASKRLQLRGCGAKISYSEDGSNTAVGAPTDGSCSIYHTNGGGVKPCGYVQHFDPCTTTNVGDLCPDGSIYIGLHSGIRLYTTAADSGAGQWSTAFTILHASSNSLADGEANTNALLASADADAPYPAAQMCRSLGAKWYLPAPEETGVIFNAKDTGAMAGTVQVNGLYWTSMQGASAGVALIQKMDNMYDVNDGPKNYVAQIRCVRKD